MERRHDAGPDDRGHRPAGFEGFFREMAAMTADRRVRLVRAGALSEAYGLPFAKPAWLPDVIARYDLTPPPAPPSPA